MHKDPTSYSIVTYAYVIAMATFGALVNVINHPTHYPNLLNAIFRLFVKIITAAFVGLLTFYYCEAEGVAPDKTAALIGVSGHFGAKALVYMEYLFKRSFNIKEDKDDNTE
jgi:hypothetical protein